MEASVGGRRRLTHQVSVVDTTNLRDLLRVKDDDESNRDSLTGLTLGAVLGCDVTRTVRVPPVSRTLLDIIRDEESGTKGLSGHNRRNWKSFRDRLRIRRASAAWTSSAADEDENDRCILQISDPISAPPHSGSTESAQPGNGPNSRRDGGDGGDRGDIVTEYDAVAAANRPVMMRLAAASATERELQRQREISMSVSMSMSNPAPVVEEVREEQPVVETEQSAVEEAEAPVRMSLMALLEETDRQSGILGSTLMGDMADEEEEEVYVDVDDEGRGGEYVCCVCMVRHKGSAFIPCGHTFCRLCSRELWVSRGNCPLCNGFILEILDIF
ncbi:uncharacterized protein LOC122069921 [Macadamia integrifolia]|uniref:uncharacterized protein LOC122069921 n=1 Tax=Macadamia integrifolia TaxID=60698 RepID=UPI001C4F41AA|nr:uncharacterized protein LOC122069921 [Macadamia integrifolia]